MAYKKLTRRSYNYKDNHMAPAGCELIDMQVVKYYKT
jgi:hypothetical protein